MAMGRVPMPNPVKGTKRMSMPAPYQFPMPTVQSASPMSMPMPVPTLVAKAVGRTNKPTKIASNFFIFFPPWFAARPMSLFHYTPAFAIAIALCAYALKPVVDKTIAGSKRHWLYLTSLTIAVLTGFALIIPVTYYLALT